MPTSSECRKIAIVYNPSAGCSGSHDLLWQIVGLLSAESTQVDLFFDIEQVPEENLARYHTLAVAGGDGSINRAAHFLLSKGLHHVPLAIIPTGTTNVLARELGICGNASSLVRIISGDETLHLNSTYISRFPFLFCASVGLDAHVLKGTNFFLKSHIGRWAVAMAALKLWAANFKMAPFQLRVDNETVENVRWAIVSRVDHYAGVFSLNLGQAIEENSFSVLVFKKMNAWHMLRYAWGFLFKSLDKSSHVRLFKGVSQLRIDTQEVCVGQFDGEVFTAKGPLSVGFSGQPGVLIKIP